MDVDVRFNKYIVMMKGFFSIYITFCSGFSKETLIFDFDPYFMLLCLVMSIYLLSKISFKITTFRVVY